MPVNAEKEITKLWRNLHSAQTENCKTYYRWREVALEFAGPDVKPLEVGLKAAEMMGKDIGKDFLTLYSKFDPVTRVATIAARKNY